MYCGHISSFPKFCFLRSYFLKVLRSGKENSVDSDQTAPSGAV